MANVKIRLKGTDSVGEVAADKVAFWEARGYERLDAPAEQVEVAPVVSSSDDAPVSVNAPTGDENGTAAAIADPPSKPGARTGRSNF